MKQIVYIITSFYLVTFNIFAHSTFSKKVLHVCTVPGQGMGDQTSKINMFKALYHEGYNVHILLDEHEEQQRFKIENIPFFVANLPTNSNRDNALYQKLLKICQENNFDILHVHYPEGRHPEEINAAIKVAKTLNISTIMTHHSGWLNTQTPLHGFDAITCVCLDVVDKIKSTLRTQKLNQPKVTWLPPFCETTKFENFKPIHTKETFFKAIANSILKPIPIITCVANFYPIKNHTTLIKGFYELKHSLKRDAYLMLAGKGKCKRECETLVQRLKLQDRVYFLDYVDNIPELLHHSDIVILPSLKEGFSIALMEGAILKKPLIGTQNTGMTSLIKNKQTGLLCNATNSRDFAVAIATYIENPILASTMGIQSQQRFYEYFTPKQCLKNLIDVYTNLPDKTTAFSKLKSIQDLEAILAESYAYFETIQPLQNSLVIFDIDDTALDTKKPTKTRKQITKVQSLSFFEPIPEVLLFYNYLITRGFNVLFLTARTDYLASSNIENAMIHSTKQNLIAAGYYSCDNIICRTHKDHAISIATWKEQMRKKLAKDWTILATLDDDDRNLQGECTGKKIKIPK